MYPHATSMLVALALLVLHVTAFWRLECDGSTGLARLDPLMAHASIGDHVHSIKGGSAFSPTSTSADLLGSNCTSCGVAQDLSAYWSPAMYFIHDNGMAEVVAEKPPHKSYYLLNTGLTAAGKPQIVEAFPNGFQMIAGNSANRNSTLPNPDPNPLGPWPDETQAQRAQRAIGFNCLHYAAGNDERTLMRHQMPDKGFLDANCKDGIRLELQFPSCWNGQLDGGPTHKSHVAYPDGVLVGNCPSGYDRRLVSLFYETIIATDQYIGKPGKFVLANGDPTGFGYHGDFISAWKDDTLIRAVQQCDQQDASGVMSACPVFELTKESAQCQLETPLPAAIAHEEVRGPMQGLANNHAIFYGPAPASPPGAPAPAKVADPAQALPVHSVVPAIPTSMAPPASPPSVPVVEEKLAKKPANTPPPKPTAAPAPPAGIEEKKAEAPIPPITTMTSSTATNQRVYTTTFYSAGQQVVEVVNEIHEDVTVVKTVTMAAPPHVKEKRGAHVKRHIHHLHQRH